MARIPIISDVVCFEKIPFLLLTSTANPPIRTRPWWSIIPTGGSNNSHQTMNILDLFIGGHEDSLCGNILAGWTGICCSGWRVIEGVQVIFLPLAETKSANHQWSTQWYLPLFAAALPQ